MLVIQLIESEKAHVEFEPTTLVTFCWVKIIHPALKITRGKGILNDRK